jgi:ABC-type antimicrobial peptide transport system permease subunit
VGSIVNLFSREFILLVLLSFVIAAPIAGIFMEKWLNNYAFHFRPGPVLYLEAVGISVAIAWISVGYRSLRAAIANPVESLRTE